MSKGAGKDADKGGPMKPVSLPALPRYDERGDRGKWVNEYDKVEAELLKTHVPGSNTTTLGLRQLPTTWDRSVPPADTDVEERGRSMPRARTTDPSPSAMLRNRQQQLHGSSSTPTFSSGGRGRGTSSPGGSPPRRPRSARPNNASSTLATAATPVPSKNLNVLLRLLFTLLEPPLQYRTQVAVDLRGIDLRWLKKFESGDRVPTMNTLETFRDEPGDVPPINSPRSAVVTLRNGVTIGDLQQKPVADFRDLGTSEDEAVTKCQHREERRIALLAALREEYRELSASVPLFELLDEVSTFKAGEWRSAEGQQRGIEDKRRMAEFAARRRDERRAEMEADQRMRIAAAERRRDAASQRIRETVDERRRAAQRAQQGGGAVSPRAEDEERAKRATEQAQRKFELAERKRLATAQAHEQAQVEARQKALRNAHRMAKNREMLQEQAREAEAERAAKEEAAKIRRAAADREALERRLANEEKARRAGEQRDAAKKKVQDKEAAMRAEADARAQRAEERLHAFASYKASQHRQAASMEAAKREYRMAAVRRAEEQRQQLRQRLVTSQEQAEQRVADMRHRQDLEVSHARLNHRLESDDKGFLVERQRRALNFKKLVYVSDLAAKSERADATVTMRRSHSSMH